MESTVRVAAVVHPRHGLLARVAAFREAHCPLQNTGFGGEVLRGDIRAEPRNARFYSGGFVGVDADEPGSGPSEVIAGCSQSVVDWTQEVEARHRRRDAGGEQGCVVDLDPGSLILGEP